MHREEATEGGMTGPTALLRDASYSLIFHSAPRVANVLMFILVGRLAGPDEAGAFALATTYLLIVTTAMRGMDDLVARQVAREPQAAPRYLTNFLVVRLLMAAALYALLTLVVLFLFDYSPETTQAILIISISVIPESITYLAHSIMLGQRDFAPTAIVWAGQSLFKLILGISVIMLGGDLLGVSVAWLVGSVLGMLIMLPILLRRSTRVTRSDWRDWRPFHRNRQALPFFIMLTTLAMLEAQSDTIILSGYHGVVEVGWYNAATTVAYSLIIFSQAFRFAIYPRMSRQAQVSPAELWRLFDQSIRMLATFITPVATGIILLAPGIVLLVFGDEFGPTVQVLQIIMIATFFVFLNEPTVRMMLVHDRQRRLTLFLLASAVLNVTLNLILAREFGASGSAIARVLSVTLYFLLGFMYVTKGQGRARFLRWLIRPGIGALAMIAPVYLTRNLVLIIPVILGALTYSIVFLLIGGITPDERKLIRQAVTSRMRGSPVD